MLRFEYNMKDEASVEKTEGHGGQIRYYVPAGGEIDEITGRLVPLGVETNLSGEEAGEETVRAYVPDGWMVGDGGRLVHVKHYNARAVKPRSEV